MDILDHEGKKTAVKGVIPGIIGAIAYVLATLACLAGLYGYWVGYSATMEAGSPDAMRLADGVMISFYAHIISIITLSLGLVFQMIAFHSYEFHPKWLWKIILITGIIVSISGILPFSPLFLILGIALLVHAFAKKMAYDDDGTVE